MMFSVTGDEGVGMSLSVTRFLILNSMENPNARTD
jgi:hypothetical protein